MNSKDRFLKMPEAKLFADMVGSEPCKKAFDYAMLEFHERMSVVGPLDQFAQLQGALQLRRIIENIAIPEEAVKPDSSPTLNYDAYNRPIRTRSAG